MQKIIYWLIQFSDVVQVTILEDNKHLIQDSIFLKVDFLEDLAEKDFELCGIGSSEIYIKFKDTEYTIQVSDFTYETKLDI